jgi:ABC-type polysaccharide/polyol phosphate transport system ATPase subunit
MSIVRFDQVSKRFTLRHERPRSLQELFLNVTHLRKGLASREKYWALKDVSFEVEPGEMVGIVGPNGAGKSTILKLTSRILEPTSGTIDVDGRIGALLELGAGFHHDLTGRENVYLNGSILGISRSEMETVYDDIVSFSEMERFIDVPVKHYSSGMYMRLGFSIAIHVRPDILLVDEALAVGDRAFQLRCLDKIAEVKRRGVAIVLVTHDLGAARNLCDRAIWLDEGYVQADGDAGHVIDEYVIHALEETGQQVEVEATELEGTSPRQESAPWRQGTREVEIVRVQFLDGQGVEKRAFRTGETFVARMHYSAHQRVERPMFGVALHHADGFHVCGPNTRLAEYSIESIEGDGSIDFIIPHLPFLQGSFLLTAAVFDPGGTEAFDYHNQAYSFRVSPSKETRDEHGVLEIPSEWRLGDASRAELA